MADYTLTDIELRNLIRKSICHVLQENLKDEGIIDKAWQGAKSFFGKGDSISRHNPIIRNETEKIYRPMRRTNSAIKNFTNKGEYDEFVDIIQRLSKIIDEHNIPLNIPIGEFIGGKYNYGRFGRLTGRQWNRKSQGSKAQRNIYKGINK